MINWQFFPKSTRLPQHLELVLGAFEKHELEIQSVVDGEERFHPSNAVLGVLATELMQLG